MVSLTSRRGHGRRRRDRAGGAEGPRRPRGGRPGRRRELDALDAREAQHDAFYCFFVILCEFLFGSKFAEYRYHLIFPLRAYRDHALGLLLDYEVR